MAETITFEKNWYRPKEIAQNGWIKNTLNSDKMLSNYDWILDEIKRGNLKAKNYGKNPKYPYYLVSAAEIERYRSEHQ